MKNTKYFNNPTLARAQIKSTLKDLTPQIYSCIALSIWDIISDSITDEEDKINFINQVFGESQSKWEALVSEGMSTTDMVRLCYEITGILVTSL